MACDVPALKLGIECLSKCLVVNHQRLTGVAPVWRDVRDRHPCAAKQLGGAFQHERTNAVVIAATNIDVVAQHLQHGNARAAGIVHALEKRAVLVLGLYHDHIAHVRRKGHVEVYAGGDGVKRNSRRDAHLPGRDQDLIGIRVNQTAFVQQLREHGRSGAATAERHEGGGDFAAGVVP